MSEGMVDNLIGLVGLLAIVLGGYVKLMTKIKELEIRLNTVEKQDDKIIDKLDQIADWISEIKIELQNKQDRK